jgi:hypothetical protein
MPRSHALGTTLLLLAGCVATAMAQPALGACTAQVFPYAKGKGTAAIYGSLLKFRLPGVEFHAVVECPDAAALSNVGFIQFLVAGSGAARYDGGTLETRHPHMPAVDSWKGQSPWYKAKVLDRSGRTFTISMSDRPGGWESLLPPYDATRHYPGGFRSSLGSLHRHVRLVTMLVEMDPSTGRYAVLDAYEWSTGIEVEVANEPGGIVARVSKAPFSTPAKPETTTGLERLDIRELAQLPIANDDWEKWWIPPPSSASKPILVRRAPR